MVDILRHTLSRREFIKAGAIAAGAAVLAACTPENQAPLGNKTASELLGDKGLDPNTIAVVPVAGKRETFKAYSTIASNDVPTSLRESVEGLGFGGAILEVQPDDITTFPEDKRAAIIKGFEEKGLGGMLMVGGVWFGGLEQLKKDIWAGEFLDHIGKRRNQEVAQCVNGERKGVGHRKWLTMVILASAAGALMGKEGINGVTLQVLGQTATSDTLNMLFTVPQTTMDTFLKTVGTTRADLYLNNLVMDKGNYVLKMMVEKGGTGTAFFLTEDVSNLGDQVRQIVRGVSQYNKLVQNDGTLGQYLAALSGLRAFWGQAKRIMRADYKTICNTIGKDKIVTPIPSTDVPLTPTTEATPASTPVPMGNVDIMAMLASMGTYCKPNGEMWDVMQIPGAKIKSDNSFMSVPWGNGVASIDMSPVFSTDR